MRKQIYALCRERALKEALDLHEKRRTRGGWRKSRERRIKKRRET